MCSINRIAITAPITAIAYDSNHHILYTGTGGQLHSHCNIGALDDDIKFDISGPTDLFLTHTIHGIKCVECKIPRIVVFGGKAVCVAAIEAQQDDDAEVKTHKLVVEVILEDLDDLVLDCILTGNKLLIGFAHNFIDVLTIEHQSKSRAPDLLYRLQCTDISALFSLSIATAPISMGLEDSSCQGKKKILVASGTAFGKIILWNFEIPADRPSVDTVPAVEATPIITIADMLTNHEGIIVVDKNLVRNRYFDEPTKWSTFRT